MNYSEEFVQDYLLKFEFGKKITKKELTNEIDRVWDSYGLDNKKDFRTLNLKDFYSHPVWILNGLFSEEDPISIKHRDSISQFIKIFFKDKSGIDILDYGGGSGVLANKAVVKVKDIKSFDIFEPWPFDFFLKKLQNNKQIKYVDKLKENAYDVVISQTVLEHVADPIETSIKCINAAKINGIIIFGSDFYPIIKCHVPDTFYLRHTFNKIIIKGKLDYLGMIPGCEYCHIFKRRHDTNCSKILVAAKKNKKIGLILNKYFEVVLLLKQCLYKLLKSFKLIR